MSREATRTRTDKPAQGGSSSFDLQPGEYLDGRYRVVKAIGSGGMGNVYEAIHLATEDPKAVKVLHRDDADFLYTTARFNREAQLTARIKHENIVDINDAGISGQGQHFIVMNLLQGESLKDWMKQFTLEQRDRQYIKFFLKYILAVCDGLIEAHHANVVHRDIKPSNIFLHHDTSVTKSRIVPKILDFGIAKPLLDDSIKLTKTGELCGTADYSSPEQVQGRKIDKRTDIFSIGCVVYEGLSGDLAYPGATNIQAITRIVNDDYRVVRPSRLNPNVTKRLDGIVLKAVRRDPEKRFESIAEFKSALEKVLSGEYRDASAKTLTQFSMRRQKEKNPESAINMRRNIFVGIPLMLLAIAGIVFFMQQSPPESQDVSRNVRPDAPSKSKFVSSNPKKKEQPSEPPVNEVVIAGSMVNVEPPKEPVREERQQKKIRARKRSDKPNNPIDRAGSSIQSQDVPTKAKTNDSKNTVKELIDKGFDEIRATKLNEAEVSLTEALSLDPSAAKALYGLGIVALKKGEGRKSIEQIQKAISKKNVLDWHIALGQAYESIGQEKEAIDVYGRVLGQSLVGSDIYKTAERLLVNIQPEL